MTLPLRHALVAAALTTAVGVAPVAVPAALAGPAHAGHIASGGPVPTMALTPGESVTLVLAAPHPRALSRAASHAATHPVGRARLAGLLPTSSARAQVVGALRARGFTVTGTTSWSVTATAPSRTVRGVFGARPVLPAHATVAQRRAATGSLPQLPASLSSVVAGVYPTTGGPRAFARSADDGTLDGGGFRSAAAPAGVTSSDGSNDAGLTIATLQLADFKASDLTAYANLHGLDDPVAAGRYRPIKVDGGPSADDDKDAAAVEVALDQESILSTAPSATQAPYFAPNTDAGYTDVFASVLDDVTQDAQARHPDPHIAALSVSWGSCEAITGRSGVTELEPVIESLVAAGVTIFASSGDDGIYDCGNRQADVDYPASSPAVVAVGGTHLASTSNPSGADNTGHNWVERAWSCTTAAHCTSQNGGGGSGGGVSGSAYRERASGAPTGTFAGFARPAYQRVGTGNRFVSTAKRLVPDIAGDGDPATGFRIYCTDTTFRRQTGGQSTGVIGGTSLASPVSAAQLVNTLGDAGLTHGVGDIHAALYSAASDTQGLDVADGDKVFRDVTSGTNGASADRGRDPSVSAAAGYDTVSGLGGVLWSALEPYLTSTAAPSAAVATAVARHQPTDATRASTIVHWVTTRGSDPILLSSTHLVVRNGQGVTVAHTAVGTGDLTVTVPVGTLLVANVTTVDLAGHATTKIVKVKAAR